MNRQLPQKIIATILLLFVLAAPGCAQQATAVPTPVPTVAPSPTPTPALTPTPAPTPDPALIKDSYIRQLIAAMPLEEKVSQLFILPVCTEDEEYFTQPGNDLNMFIRQSQPGGYILFSKNITDEINALTDALAAQTNTAPFIGMDEEGGSISRLSGLPGYQNQPSAEEIGENGDPQNAFDSGAAIGGTLAEIGVNVDFAPVADVLLNEKNTVIGSRSYGSDTETVTEMVAAFQAGLHSQNIMSAPKHFPGHGATVEDSHDESAINPLTAEELRETSYPPFQTAIEEGAEFIMVGHMILPQADESGLPACLSPYFCTDVLRGELAFSGVITTDAMNMSAITSHYTAGEAAVLAIQAGVDMILVPEDYAAAKEAVLQAIQNGDISTKRIGESLYRILDAKITAGLLAVPGL